MRLSQRRLNRATLVRQSLAERTDADVVSTVDRLGGLQAQEPASPYLALWTRLDAFDPETLTRAVAAGDVVKAVLHRSTLHLVSADDYNGSISALTTVLRTKWMGESRGRPVKRELPELTEAALAYADEPRTNAEMRAFAGTLGEPVPGDELWRRIRRYGGFVSVPEAATWSYGRRPIHVAARAWLGGEPADEDGSLAHIVRSHLRAFGPARLADVAQWSGLGIRKLERGAALIEDLVHHETEDGHDLLDLDGSPVPHEDLEVPPRFLPMWDETLLAYKDRTRLMPEAYRKRVIAPNGDVRPTFILDGNVAGLWWSEQSAPEAGPRIMLEPFRDLTSDERDGLEAEGERLAAFLAEREPLVYSRYRR